MKNLFKYTIAGIASLLALSCQQELTDNTVPEETTVRFTVNAPVSIDAKAADLPGGMVDRLYVELYTDEACTELYGSMVVEGKQTTWDLEMSVLKGKTYQMLLVAGCDGNFYPKTDNGTFSSGIKMPFSGPSGSETLNANREEHDVFVAKTSFTAKTAGGSITLARPMAQINVYADDFANGPVDGLELVDQSVTLQTADEYDILTGETGEAKTMTFKTEDSYGNDGRVLMFYVLPEGGQKSLIDMELTLNFKLNGVDQTISHNLTNVPVETNHRTNISGQLYVENAEFSFSLGDFTGSSDVDVWDGTTTDPVEPDPETPNTYVIMTAEQLAWFRDMVNGNDTQTRAATPETFKDKTVMLGADIDLSGQEWEPIGYNSDSNSGIECLFKGVFDGNGYTIKNFKISQKHNDSRGAALFGVVGSATIRNLNISNANIIYPGSDDFYAAGVAGYGYSTTFENITVSDSFIEGNNKIGGIYGHTDTYESNPVIITNCHVSNCTLRSDNEDDGGLVGGLVGVVQNGGHNKISKSSVKNCTIFGHNKNSEGKRSNGEFVANIIGNDQIILEITDCEISGNTFTQAENVTYVSPYGPLVGGNRNEGKGKVIIDGLEIIANGVGINAEGEYEISNANGMKWLAQTVNAGTGLSEKTVKLTADIDLKNELWTPIGISESNSFKGLFDGQNKTISNLKIESDSRSGLFGYVGRDSGTNDGNIYGSVRNLKVHNVDMKTSSGAAVVGNLFRGEISGIELTGLVKIEGSAQNVAGVVGYHYANVNDITVNVEEGSYVKSSEGYIGGVAGYSGEGSYTKKNITSNIDVIGCGEAVGGIIALLQYGNVIENAKCSADVTNTPPVNSHNRYIRTGGIAGCWVESNSGKTTVKNCEFTGTVKAERQDGLKPSILPHGGLVGFSYSSSGIASLDIDGKLYADAYKSAGLENAVKTAGVTVFLSAGPWGDGSTITPYTRPATIASNVTIEGVKEAKLEMEATNWEIAGAGNLTVRGINISWPAQTYSGFSHAEGIRFVDVTFDGAFFCWNESTSFSGCTFNLNSDQYIWTYTCDVDFNDCTFNCVDGKGILIYHEGTDEVTVNLNRCTFSSSKKASTGDGQAVAAIEIDNSQQGAVMNVNITECTSEGGFNYDTAIWRAKKSVFENNTEDKLNIIIDGVKQTI